MTRRAIDHLLITTTALSCVVAIAAWIPGRPGRAGAAPSEWVATADAPDIPTVGGDVIDSLTTVISDRDPFRLTREPSSVAYAPDRSNAPALPPAPPKPPITVSGIIGPPWVAVLEGAPGHEGSWVAKSGDTVSRAPFALTVLRRITRDTVILSAPDTTWTLSVRAAWR